MKFRKSVWGIVFRIVISLIITFYLAIHARDLAFVARVVKQPAFYLSMAVSFPITFAIVYWVHWISLVLDEKYYYRLNYIKRSFLQLLFGVLVPVCFDLLFVTAFALFEPIHFDTTEFFTIDLPLVVILIVVLNLLYSIRSIISESKEKAEQGPINLYESPTILVRYGKVAKKLDVKQDVLYFYLSKPNVMVVTSEREYSLGKGTINKMEELYSNIGFCRISSRTLVNMSIVKDLSQATARYNFKLGFFDPSVIPDPDSEDLLVKGEYREKVTALLEKD
ncbi:MAG: LytTR family DNA-binding domain-containing protein [Fluviicola sp.]